MSKLSREKIALLIFALLVLFGLGSLMFYITNVGHSFNGVASTIDDATGDLGDYTAIVYAGTAEEKKALNEAGLEGIAEEGSNKTLELGHDQSVKSTSDSDEVVASDVAPKSSSAAATENAEEKEPVSVTDVRDSFLRKNASVFVLDLSDPTAYLDRTVVKAGKYRFGLIYVDEVSALPHYIKSRIAEYEDIDVDFVVAVVDNLARIPNTEGIDIVVSAQEEGLNPVGVWSDGTFFNDAALVGEVGTLLISPSKAISAKDISEL